jgi:hypothetical protein
MLLLILGWLQHFCLPLMCTAKLQTNVDKNVKDNALYRKEVVPQHPVKLHIFITVIKQNMLCLAAKSPLCYFFTAAFRSWFNCPFQS